MTIAARSRSASRNAGRSLVAALVAALVGAVLLVVLIGVAALFWFYLAEAPAPQPQPVVEVKGESAPVGEAPGAGAPVAVERTSAPAVEVGAAPAEEAVATTAPVVDTLTIRGIVVNESGSLIEGATVRWARTSVDDLGDVLHDGRVFGETIDVARVANRNLATALSESITATTDAEGAFTIETTRGDSLGVVFATGAGYSVATQPIDGVVGAVRDLRGAPRVDGTGEPAVEVGAPQGSADAVELVLTLESAGRISGRVTDADTGEPAAGMLALAGVTDPDLPAMMNFVAPDAPRATVGADGTYELVGLENGVYTVVARSGETEWVSIRSSDGRKVELEEGVDVTDVDLRVSRGGRIVARIVNEAGEPIAGAEGAALPKDFIAESMSGNVEGIMLMTRNTPASDAEGLVEFRGLELGREYTVNVNYKGLAPGASDAVKLTKEAPAAEVEVKLTPGSSISGRVVYKSGKPAARARVSVLPDMQEVFAGNILAAAAGDARDTTDESGAFKLEHLRPGKYRLVTGRVNPQEIMQGGEQGKLVVLDGSADVSGVEIVIDDESEKAVGGRVVSTAGEPLAGATVRVAESSDFALATASTATTDDDGYFRAERLTGEMFRVQVRKAGFSTEMVERVSPGSFDLSVVLAQNGYITGKVVTSDGSPVGAGGKAAVRPVEAGFMAGLEELMQIGTVGAQSSTTEIAPDGTFAVESAPGKVLVHVTVPGFAPGVSEEIALGDGETRQGVQIVVSAGAVLHGKVVVAGSTEGLAGAQVVAVRADGNASDMLGQLMPQLFARGTNRDTTDENGEYAIEHLAPGAYKLMAAHVEWAPSEPREQRVGKDQIVEVPVLTLVPGSTVVGVVLENDKPKAGVFAQLMGDGVPMQQSPADGEGRFRFRNLRAGEYLVNVVDMAGMQMAKMRLKSKPVTVGAAEEVELTFVFGLGHKVSGTIKGLPPSGGVRMITLRRPGGPAPEDVSPTDMKATVESARYQVGVAMIAPDNTYEVGDLEPGAYILEIPRMPDNPADLAAYEKMDRTPWYRGEVSVEDGDVTHDIEIGAAKK